MTIVITHNLSKIGSKDFVYVLKEGTVVMQFLCRFRYDEQGGGEFR